MFVARAAAALARAPALLPRAPLAARSLATLKDKEKGAEKDWANRQEAEQLKRLRETAAPAPPTSAGTGAGVAAALSKSPRGAASTAAAGAITRFDASPRFSGATKHRHTLYLTGQVPEESTFSLGVAAQTRSVLAKVDALLKAGGSDRGRLLTASVFLTDIATFPEMNAEYVSWLAGAPAPARTTIEAKLANPGWKVEIAVIAACD
jgi:enamine deaminase RidA (YjgF/YER057c/UK114 family)